MVKVEMEEPDKKGQVKSFDTSELQLAPEETKLAHMAILPVFAKKTVHVWHLSPCPLTFINS